MPLVQKVSDTTVVQVGWDAQEALLATGQYVPYVLQGVGITSPIPLVIVNPLSIDSGFVGIDNSSFTTDRG